MVEYSEPIIVIAGPTASGKSSIALKLAKEINGVIINADSRQVYKELLIGTARPTGNEMDNIPHHLYGHISVKKKYNIYRYQKDVAEVLKSLPPNQTPILVGGTGLYIDSVVFNYILKENNFDSEKRQHLESKSIEELHKIIPKDILDTLNQSDRNNKRRLVRVIEKNNTIQERGQQLNHIYFVVDIPPTRLKERIVQRVDKMFAKGLVEENTKLREAGLEGYPALQTIGYQEFDSYFKKGKNLKEIKEEIINHTNQYAKRQRTWFRRHNHAIWINTYEEVLEKSLKLIRT
jgi:tRNA dimethylallyltransferase